jgi:hypothetical protein
MVASSRKSENFCEERSLDRSVREFVEPLTFVLRVAAIRCGAAYLMLDWAGPRPQVPGRRPDRPA